MSDLDLVRETYASMPDEKLMQLAGEDLSEMTEGAFEILKAEFNKRSLDINDYLHKEDATDIPDEPLPGFENEKNSADKAMMGLSYQDIMYPADPEKEMNEKKAESASLSKLGNKGIERLMIKASWTMFLFAALFCIGMLITLETVIKPSEDGRPVFAYGAIFGGLIGFFYAWNRKRIYRNQLTNFDFEKEKRDE